MSRDDAAYLTCLKRGLQVSRASGKVQHGGNAIEGAEREKPNHGTGAAGQHHADCLTRFGSLAQR